ncbi:hypothetical protein N7495_002541 [Penicillium taxi]|uniref:uncharacterized protein n=1 Tax=Penicillium taxi TaxID=168475 RepID=UPI002545074B|nr:uncharacterized protein N7495_002541 [Penicillium taxi]KAJ5902013.1 hypothetical protein N7495_002541 [Penicillium taxi]
MVHQPLRLELSSYTTTKVPKPPPAKNPYINPSLFREAPFSCLQAKKAVALDCEMVQVRGGQVCAYLSAVDFITGEILMDCFVQPGEYVTDWCSRYSGVTKTLMDKAIFNATALRGWEDARENLFSYVDLNTIIIGHALDNDLNVLGIIHAKIIDTSILIAEKVFLRHPSANTQKFPRQYGLKVIVKELMGFSIQSSRMGHMALEDAQATRDLLLWCIKWPDILDRWAFKAYQIFETQTQERERKVQDAKLKRDKLLQDAKGPQGKSEREKLQEWKQKQFLEREDLRDKHSTELQTLLQKQALEFRLGDEEAKLHAEQLMTLQAKQSKEWGKLCLQQPQK